MTISISAQTQLFAILGVERADLIALEFGVFVVVARGAKSHRIEGSIETPLAREVDSSLIEPESNVLVMFIIVMLIVVMFILMFVFMIFIVVMMAMAGQTVITAQTAHRNRERRPFADPAQTPATATRFTIGVFETAVGDAQVVSLEMVEVSEKLQAISGMTADPGGDSALVRSRITAHLHRPGERGLVSRQRKARCDDVDGACCGGRTEEQCGRSTHDLDTVGEHGVEPYGVIVRQGRDIEGVGTVLEGLYAQPALASDDGAARDRPERTGRDAWLIGERFAEAALAARNERIARKHRHGLCGLEYLFPKWGSRDHDFLEVSESRDRFAVNRGSDRGRQDEHRQGGFHRFGM
jgi:flagellar basal body-associated protein FliL